MKKTNQPHFYSTQSPTTNLKKDFNEIQKTKTLKKHKYFSTQTNEENYLNQSKPNDLKSVLDELANYAYENNQQIPWTKKYNWEQILLSSEQKSTNDDEKIKQKRYGKQINQEKQKNQGKAKDKDLNKKGQKNKSSYQTKRNNHFVYKIQQHTTKFSNKFDSLESFSYKGKEQYGCTDTISLDKTDHMSLTNFFKGQKQQQMKVGKEQEQDQSDNQSLVDFLLKINKITQTKTFSLQQRPSQKKEYPSKSRMQMQDQRNNSDSEDFDQFLRLVQMQQLKRKQKEQLSRNNHTPSKHPNFNQFNQHKLNPNPYNQFPNQIESPIVARRRPIRTITDDQENIEESFNLSGQSNVNNKNNLLRQNYLFISSQLQEPQSSEISMVKNKNINIQNQNNKHSRSSEFKPCRLKKERQQETTCTICLEQIIQRATLPCKHQFCLDCLKDWIQKTSSCPICRKDAKYYKFNNQKFQVEHKKYSLENYLDNIGGDEDQSYDSEDEVDYECQNCDQTKIGDDIIVCDRCLVNASHIDCDVALDGVVPPSQMNWYCSVCRQAPMLWFLESRGR